MLELKNIVKRYSVGDTTTVALNDISLNLRKNEFVAILGPSGCGKTTMLNVIGGLDQYDSGELVINGIPTKEYSSRDWDSYRNHSIGFVFQSYNLIPHQSVLSNVELALTLSGIGKAERRQRALAALEKVGIADQAKKKPNQLSGGQMQRVAIARALVNNPEILLADEPTGALDSATSIQIMEILKEIAKDKLVIMVTHNPELAEQYATRTVCLLDGKIQSDSMPYDGSDEEKAVTQVKKKTKNKKTSMSFFTALSLSLNNLLTKKARTVLTSFAGSIGIIGIALILSLSNGFQLYIDKVQEDTLSSYPITVEKETIDMNSLMLEIMDKNIDNEEHDPDKVYTNTVLSQMFETMLTQIQTNDLESFKYYIDSNYDKISDYVTDVQYTYDIDFDIYALGTEFGDVKVNPSTVFSTIMGVEGNSSGASSSPMMPAGNSTNMWREMIGNQELLESQYELINEGGHWPENYDEVILFVNSSNEISDVAMYALGLRNQDDIEDQIAAILKGEELSFETESFTFEEMTELSFSLVTAADYYAYDESTGLYADMSNDKIYVADMIEDGIKLKIVGIARPREEAAATSFTGTIGYTHELVEKYIELTQDSEVVKAQKSEEIWESISESYGKEYRYCDVDIFTGIPFDYESEEIVVDMEYIYGYIATLPESEQATTLAQIDMIKLDVAKGILTQMLGAWDDTADPYAFIATLPEEQQAAINTQIDTASSEIIIEMFSRLGGMTDETSATFEKNISLLNASELSTPSTINFYAVDFESKEKISAFIEEYNSKMESEGNENSTINYTDYIGIMMSSISTIINTISYVLIAFVAISLVVSSIMIGIITYISVLERTKEIGILRSIGASKTDISRVFNAETLIVGFSAGAIGILITLLLNIPINMIIYALSDIPDVAALPVEGAIWLIIISMVLTLIAGVIPSRIAARKDPVEALRTE